MKTVSPQTFLDCLGHNILIFDTRSEAQFKRDGLIQAKHLPLEALQNGEFPDLAKDQAIYLLCEYGQISELGALYMESAGFSCVYNVTGGMKALREHAKLSKE